LWAPHPTHTSVTRQPTQHAAFDPAPTTNHTQGATKGSKAVGTKVVTPEPSLNLPLALLAISGASAAGGVKPLAVIAGILGVFLAIQSQRVK
jgi:hypothetical protein